MLAQVGPDRIAGAAISNQRETFGIFDEKGHPVRQGMVWLDERAMSQTEALADKVGRDRIHEISGKPADVVVPINRLVWLSENEPENMAKTAHYADVHCFLAHKLTGAWTTSIASADPSGMLELETGKWSGELLEAARVPPAIMPGLAKPAGHIGEVTSEAAADTGLVEKTPIFAGGGDGQCAACGAGVVAPSLAYMNLGTAIVAGVHSSGFGHDKAFRTMTAVSDSGYIFETVLKSGTFLVDWFSRVIGGVSDGEKKVELLRELEKEAQQSPIGAGGMAILPFWQGSMTPHWDAKARGIMAGLSGSTKRGDIYRAVLEGLALDQAYALEKAMASLGGKIERIIAIGGGAASSLLLQIIADSTDTDVCKAEVAEASALGAAMCAAKGVGWHPTLREASQAMCQKDLAETRPIPENVARYAQLREVYDDLWPTLAKWNEKLWEFANNP